MPSMGSQSLCCRKSNSGYLTWPWPDPWHRNPNFRRSSEASRRDLSFAAFGLAHLAAAVGSQVIGWGRLPPPLSKWWVAKYPSNCRVKSSLYNRVNTKTPLKQHTSVHKSLLGFTLIRCVSFLALLLNRAHAGYPDRLAFCAITSL